MDENDFERALAEWAPGILPDEQLDRVELGEQLIIALDALTPETRATLWLVDVEGFTHREAGAMLGVPEGTVASRLFRGRRALRDALGATWSERTRRANG